MKFNWATAIVTAFILFMAFILYFVFRVQGNAKYDNELVVEEYYKKDTRYSEEMAKLQNAFRLDEQPAIIVVAQGVLVTFPQQIATRQVRGEMSFYRPSAKQMDFILPLIISGRSMLVSKDDLAAGRWDITLSWHADGKEYMMKKSVYLN